VKILQVQPAGKLREAEWNQKTHAVIFGPENGLELRMKVIAPRPLKAEKESHNKEFTRGMYRLVMDEPPPASREIRVIDPGHMLDSDLEQLTLGLEQDLKEEAREEKVETVTLITIFSVAPRGGPHPDIHQAGSRLQVGPHHLQLTGQGWKKAGD
jgi:hypothetical protein